MEHDVILRTPTFLGGGSAPAVLRRVDQRFVEGLLREVPKAPEAERLVRA